MTHGDITWQSDTVGNHKCPERHNCLHHQEWWSGISNILTMRQS